jgi:hypothetical protein
MTSATGLYDQQYCDRLLGASGDRKHHQEGCWRDNFAKIFCTFYLTLMSALSSSGRWTIFPIICSRERHWLFVSRENLSFISPLLPNPDQQVYFSLKMRKTKYSSLARIQSLERIAKSHSFILYNGDLEEHTGTHLITQVKQCWARIVLGGVITQMTSIYVVCCQKVYSHLVVLESVREDAEMSQSAEHLERWGPFYKMVHCPSSQ